MTVRVAFLIAILGLGACEFEGAPVPDQVDDPTGPDASPDPMTTVYRINIGGDTVVATEAPNAGTWSADNDECSGNVFGPVEPEVNGTSDPALYTFYRWGDISCDLPITNGSHRVRFLLAEVWSGGGSCNSSAVARNMEIEIEGVVRASLDLVGETGGCAVDPAQPDAVPFDRSFDVEVTDGMLNVNGIHSGDGALINAIEVVSL